VNLFDVSDTFQSNFYQRWHHLNDPHVRALAWLLDSPDLLDPNSARWQGKIATLSDEHIADWLSVLDLDPSSLHEYLGLQPLTRLGRYAEKLLAFYFSHRKNLLAHGVQVRAGKKDTIGEFDFLLQQGDAVLHWEFATKFYLFEPTGSGHETDYFVGPNLADTLGAKMHKILHQQLALGQHPAAQQCVPQPITLAQALIKGWLFYRADAFPTVTSMGVSQNHCRGFWCTVQESAALVAERYVILPRLSWLAPAKVNAAHCVDKVALQLECTRHFMSDTMPLLVALLRQEGDYFLEISRGFVVPNDWRIRAGERAIHKRIVKDLV
jgi:hypothetical protein